LQNINWPPKSPQKDTEQLTASSDRNPKNLVLQSGYIWFSQAINYNNRAAVQWHQVKLDGTIVQTGLISSETSSYIQTTIAVNKKNNVVIGFQETRKICLSVRAWLTAWLMTLQEKFVRLSVWAKAKGQQ